MMANIFSQPDGEGRSIEEAPLLHADWSSRVTAASVAREARPESMLSPEPAILAQISRIWTILGERANRTNSSEPQEGEIASSEVDRASLALARAICMRAHWIWEHERALIDRLRELERQQMCQKDEQPGGEQGEELSREERRFFALGALLEQYRSALSTFGELALDWGRMAERISRDGGCLQVVAHKQLSLHYSLSYACEVQQARLLQLAAFAQQRIVEIRWERMDHLYPKDEIASLSCETREEEEEEDGPKLWQISDELLAAHIQEVEEVKAETEQMDGRLPLEQIGFADQLQAEITEHVDLCRTEQVRRKMLTLTGKIIKQQVQQQKQQQQTLKLNDLGEEARRETIMTVAARLLTHHAFLRKGLLETGQLVRLVPHLSDASKLLLLFAFSCGSSQEQES